MRILLTGPTGQIGSALLQTLPLIGEVVALDHCKLDLAEPGSIRAAVREARPDVIVNAAAYTAVDQAEREELVAFRINAEGPAVLGEAAKRSGALLVHFSTDYVFDGEKAVPYVETDTPNPLNAYGRSKLAGERMIQAIGCRHLIFRTSWIYSSVGKNFLLTILRIAREGKPLRVVDDQYGAPTSNLMIAAAVPVAITRGISDPSLDGIYHMTASGETTWYNFARVILESEASAADLFPIASHQYDSPARRPANSRLDNKKLRERLHTRLPSWQQGVLEVLQTLR